MKVIKKIDYQFKNLEPCYNPSCGESNKIPCFICGRIKSRGEVIIQTRTEFVHLERLTPIYIREHNSLLPDEQKKNTLYIWKAQKDVGVLNKREQNKLNKIKEKKKLKK